MADLQQCEVQKDAGYLRDHEGNKSEIRVMSVLAFFAAIGTQVLAYIKPPTDYYFTVYVFTAWLIAAFAPKVVQKFAEILPTALGKK